ncbi:MAG TPA: HNH endonuclease signature motif containing protein, partial [Acidimicrobiales bacterium]|nr:HNH endonuclease signature motif containing protein [Acidimicrobiales bacterium]
VTVADLARTAAQRRHDALVEMARRSATAPADGKRPKPLLTVLVGEDAFRNVLELADGTLISPATAADLLDEAVIETMLFEGPSRVLELGHQRNFLGAARRAVEVVHRTCTGKGCHVRSERCEIDHILPSGVGGPTVPDNGRPQCRPHHRQHHQAVVAPPRPPPEADGDRRLTGAAHLELARARIRDRLRHDPAWGALAAAPDEA